MAHFAFALSGLCTHSRHFYSDSCSIPRAPPSHILAIFGNVVLIFFRVSISNSLVNTICLRSHVFTQAFCICTIRVFDVIPVYIYKCKSVL